MNPRPILVLACWSIAVAQTPNTGAIRGQVLDQSTGAVARATVEAVNRDTGFTRQTLTDMAGYYTLADLPLTGEYRLRASAQGLAAKDLDHIALRAGEIATFQFTLSPESGRSEVTVFGTVEGVRSDSSETGARLDLQQIDHTPVFGRKITALATMDASVKPARGAGDLFLNNPLFVVYGGGRRQTSFVIDGSSGDDSWGRQTLFTNIPLAAIQEFAILTNAFSAEYGRTSGSVINVNTRSGSNQYHGDMVGLWRPPGIQARTPLSGRRTADRLDQASGAFSGPIVQDRTHFLVSAEYDHQDKDSSVTSPLVAPQNFLGRYRQTLALLRLDHQIDSRNSLTGRVNLDRYSTTNPNDGVGGNTLPSAARTFTRNTYSAQLAETAVLSASLINQARLQYMIASPITQFVPVTLSMQIVRTGIATEGDSRYANLQNHQWEMGDTLSFTHGAHNLKFGGAAIHSSSGGFGQEFGGGYVLGQATLNPGVTAPRAALTIQDVARYTQSFGNGSYKVTEWLASVFMQDSWKVSPTLTLDLGLRYDGQTFTDDARQWSPRAGFAWNPRADHRTVIRGGYGIYYSEIRANTAAGYQIMGPQGIFTFTATPGQLGFPATLAPLSAFPAGAILPARDINVRAGDSAYLSQFFDVSLLHNYPARFLNPRTQQATFGIERELKSRWVLSADYVHQRTTRIDRTLDVNAPAPFVRTAAGQVRSAAAADLTRPIVPVPNGYRRIIATVNDGLSQYDGLAARLTRRFSHGFSILASYTWSHTIDTVEPDFPGQDPSDANLLGRWERGNSLLDQRHRAVLTGWWQLPHNWSVGTVTSLAAGRPFNVTTGVDNNGDASTADRPVIGTQMLGRNTGGGTPIYDAQLFVERTFALPGDRAQLSLRGEAFNSLNHSNIVGRSGVWGNAATPLPAFGQAVGGISNVDPGREFQFSLRVRF
jgi:hypothetical protein